MLEQQKGMKEQGMARILLVEDNNSIIMGLGYLLEEEKFTYDVAGSKRDALSLLDIGQYELILLDIGLPDGSGFELCQYVKEKTDTPVIFLTAKDEEQDVVRGLDMGADDYIIKPFRNRELLSRIRNVFRRNGVGSSGLSCGPVTIHTTSGKVFRDEQEITLTKLEYKILVNLFSNQNRLIAREEILNFIWDEAGNYVNDNTLTVYIKRIREKIGDKEGKIIQTVRGLGYRVGEK